MSVTSKIFYTFCHPVLETALQIVHVSWKPPFPFSRGSKRASISVNHLLYAYNPYEIIVITNLLS